MMTNRQIIKFAQRLVRAKNDDKRNELMGQLTDPSDYAAAFYVWSVLVGKPSCELVCDDPVVIRRVNELAELFGSTHKPMAFH